MDIDNLHNVSLRELCEYADRNHSFEYSQLCEKDLIDEEFRNELENLVARNLNLNPRYTE